MDLLDEEEESTALKQPMWSVGRATKKVTCKETVHNELAVVGEDVAGREAEAAEPHDEEKDVEEEEVVLQEEDEVGVAEALQVLATSARSKK